MRVGILSRSPSTIASLTDWLAAPPRAEVAWTRPSVEALQLEAVDAVDVVLLDVDTVEPQAAAAARERARGAPVLAVTAKRSSGASRVYDAMTHGAVDVVALDGGQAGLRQALLPHGRAAAVAPWVGLPPIVAIGASTGGPPALLTVLSAFPVEFRAAVIVCQHVEGGFDDALASWLSRESGHHVATVGERTMPRAGNVYLAVPGAHLVLEGQHLERTALPSGSVHLPSIDVLFQSLARGARRHCTAAALLTGMGRDGAEGLLAMRSAGFLTIAQDEATSVVYSMPRAAKELRAASRILPIGAIGPALASFVATLGSLE